MVSYELPSSSYDSKIKDRYKEMLKSFFMLNPSELFSMIGKVQLLPRNSKSLAKWAQGLGTRKGNLEVSHSLFELEPKNQELVLLHELGGHALLDFLKRFSPNSFEEVKEIWLQVFRDFPEIISKDRNSRSKLHENIEGIGGLQLQEEEFISDRMAEFFINLSQKYNDERIVFLRSKDQKFTLEKETASYQSCRKTYEIFLRSRNSIQN
jgi:hypothetical protein